LNTTFEMKTGFFLIEIFRRCFNLPLKATQEIRVALLFCRFSTKGNLPALPGDPKSLTVPGVNESLPSVNRSKFLEKEAFDQQRSKPMSFGMGLQVSRGLDTKMS
jgi:hypothetical protein